MRVRVCACARVQQATKQTNKVGAWARGTLRPSPPAPRDVVRVVEVELKKKNVCRGMLNAFVFFVLHFSFPNLIGNHALTFGLRPKERQAGPRSPVSSSFTCFAKQKTEGETNNQANKVLLFFFYPKNTNKSLTTLNNPNNPARKHKQQYPPTLPASAPCRRSDKVRPQKHALEQTPQRLKKLYSIFYKKK